MAAMGAAHKDVEHKHLRAAAEHCNNNAPRAERAVNTRSSHQSQGITSWVRSKAAASPAGV